MTTVQENRRPPVGQSCIGANSSFFERARPVCEQAIGSVRVTGL